MGKNNRKKINAAVLFVFIVYAAYLMELLFFIPYRHAPNSASQNVIPFKTIRMYILYYRYFQFEVWFSNLFGNIFMFMPFGFFLPILFRRMRKAWIMGLLSCLASALAEIIQGYFHVGGFDVDDILLNTTGGLCGYGIFLLVRKLVKKIKIEIWR
ncbi:VanZ family protein [Heyndrickxia coagulans]|nr:VanZ family protein [Heyndrickxia coagulans]